MEQLETEQLPPEPSTPSGHETQRWWRRPARWFTRQRKVALIAVAAGTAALVGGALVYRVLHQSGSPSAQQRSPRKAHATR
jgi:hypothetical protein